MLLCEADALIEEEESGQTAHFNKLVTEEDLDAIKNRRIRWLSQICEYWPLRRLASITESDVEAVLKAYSPNGSSTHDKLPSTLVSTQNQGRIVLAGSGPGHPDLLTLATYRAIQSADIILADKLVPAPVLDLIPRRTPIHIARKFPGNAERAQEELLALGLEGLKAGKYVLRLKQGDPYIYGRGGEEYNYFRGEGFESRITVLPGITSALSAPLFAGISATHRAVASQVLICTGTGRRGVAPEPPSYNATQTVVFLMALHRLQDLINSLTTSHAATDDEKLEAKRVVWPLNIPCAVIERASCPDQRVIRSTLEYVCAAVEEEGSRPPGLLVVGKACEALHKTSQKWVVEDGFQGMDGIASIPDGLTKVLEVNS
jgi:uroporphyrin-III C-methyltransferase